jgi:tetratricopeptide (TPR) repeat protein
LGETRAELYKGIVAVYRGDYVTAEAIFTHNLELINTIGSGIGKANCIARLAEIAYLRLDHSVAQSLLSNALAMYRWLDDPLGKTFCEWRLGQLAILNNNVDLAHGHFKSAMSLVRRNPDDLALPGWEALFRAQSSTNAEEANREFQKARSIWEALGRRTLIVDLIDHDPLGPTAPTQA